MLARLYYFILTNTAPLYRVLYQSDYFFIDLWSINHFISGFILMIILLRKQSRHPFAILIFLLFFYECLEMAFTYLAVNIFRPEIIQDQFTDIVVGFFGGFLGWKFVRTKRKENKAFEIQETIHEKKQVCN